MVSRSPAGLKLLLNAPFNAGTRERCSHDPSKSRPPNRANQPKSRPPETTPSTDLRARRVAALRRRLRANDIVGASRDADRTEFTAPRATQSGHRILSCLARLCRAHMSWMFSATSEEPPREYGMMWSKCRLSLLPHSTHLPWSRFHTASYTSVGISRFCSRRGSRASTIGVASGSTSSRNLNTNRPLDSSRQPSTSLNVPLNVQIPVRIFSYTRTRSAGVPSSRYCEAACRNKPFWISVPPGPAQVDRVFSDPDPHESVACRDPRK